MVGIDRELVDLVPLARERKGCRRAPMMSGQQVSCGRASFLDDPAVGRGLAES
jgi:hypothetical protein